MLQCTIDNIRYTTGNILDDNSEALVNTVNCKGVMGRGVALEFKKRFPENFKAYAEACAQGELKPGKMFVFSYPKKCEQGEVLPGQMALFGEGERDESARNLNFIINFPTKNHWRNPSKIRYIEDGLDDLARVIHELGIRKIAMPALGCGHGGLEWRTVRECIEERLGGLENLDVVVYEPQESTDTDFTLL